MSRKIEEAFNDCFERLLSGESLDSCISSYPEYAADLDTMLRTAFDVKRRAFPVQPRPEFKYWSRVRLQGVQDYVSREPAPAKSSISNLRRNLAISLSALLVFALASTGTAAASYDAMPDQPLYEVKLAVEQVQITLTPSDTAKAELYATLAEKRAQEIAVMADQGKTDKVISTTERLYNQLTQAETLLTQSEMKSTGWNADNVGTTPNTATTPPAAVSSPTNAPSAVTTPTVIPPQASVPPVTKTQTSNGTSSQGQIVSQNQTVVKSATTDRKVIEIDKARAAINASNTKSLAILQSALDKAPASVKSNLSQIIERTRKSNERINSPSIKDQTPRTTNPDSKSDDKDKHDNGNPPQRKNSVRPSPDSSSDKDDPSSDSGEIDTAQGTIDNGRTGDDNDIDTGNNSVGSKITATTVKSATANITPQANKIVPKLSPVGGGTSDKTGITK
jgi:hypothetical protein